MTPSSADIKTVVIGINQADAFLCIPSATDWQILLASLFHQIDGASTCNLWQVLRLCLAIARSTEIIVRQMNQKHPRFPGEHLQEKWEQIEGG